MFYSFYLFSSDFFICMKLNIFIFMKFFHFFVFSLDASRAIRYDKSEIKETES